MKQKLLLLFAVLLTALTASAGNTIYYTSSDGNLVTPFNSEAFGAEIVSNTYAGGRGKILFNGEVTTIGNRAFMYRTNLTSVVIPNSVTTIGEYAFWECNNLISVEIPNSVTTIEEKAFSYCSSLTSVEIPNSVTTIGEKAFIGCSLTSVEIPNSVTTIGGATFWCCTSLTSVEIPNSVTTIGTGAFLNCTSLTSVVIGNSVTTIGNGAFAKCTSLKEIISLNTTPPTFYDYNAFDEVDMSTCVLKVPAESVKLYKAAEVWKDFKNIVAIEAGGTQNNVIFYTSTDGKVVTPKKSDVFGANIVSNTYENGQGKIVFDGDVTEIGESAFSSCKSLTSLVIPNSVKTMGRWVFFDCTSLTSLEIPNSVTTIGYGMFRYCSSLEAFNGKFASDDHRCLVVDGTLNSFAPAGLTSYTIPNNVTTIGIEAFYNCTNLTSVEIPNSVTTIGNDAFEECTGLKEIASLNTTPPTVENPFAFYNVNKSTCILKVPAESVELYKAAQHWKSFKNIVAIEAGGTQNNVIYYTSSDGNIVNPYMTNAFGANIVSNTYEDGQGKIVFDGDVTKIGDEAFMYCSSLTSVEIGNSVTTIGDEAFLYCSSLTSVEIGNSVTTIGDGAFRYCFSLTSVEIANSVTTIGNGAFEFCKILTSVEIPNSVTTIGEGAFVGCYSLEEFNGKFTSDDHRCLVVDGTLNSFAPAGLTTYKIPNNVTRIGDCAFSYCYNLTSVEIPNSVTTIGKNAFMNCSSLTSVEIGNSVTTIGDGAFSSCYRLTSVEIPNSVTTIGKEAFYYYPGLNEIVSLNTTPPTVEDTNAFKNVDKETCVLKVPAESVELYKAAYVWQDFYNIIGIDAAGIEAVQGAESRVQRTAYSINGVKVGDGYKGIVIKNGRKVLKK